jgi:hypothetical protein
MMIKHALAWVIAACAFGTGCASVFESRGPRPVPAEYTALPDTLVCVVDRAASRGLREIPGKNDRGNVLLLVDGRVTPLEEAHPIDMIAGYAGREAWLTRGDPVTFEGRSFNRYGGERRIRADLLRRVGEHQGILLFADGQDPPPIEALYVPTAPGCIFQPFVRQELTAP